MISKLTTSYTWATLRSMNVLAWKWNPLLTCKVTGKEIRELEMTEAYKYLGIQQADSIKNKQMKDITRKEYKNVFEQF